MEPWNKNLSSVIGQSNKIMKLISLIMLSILLLGSTSNVKASIVWSEDFEEVSLEDLDLVGWDDNSAQNVEIEDGFTIVDGALKAPASRFMTKRSQMTIPSTIVNGTWSFDLNIDNIEDTHPVVDYMWTDLSGDYNETGKLSIARIYSGYSLAVVTYERDGDILDGPGITALVYDDTLIAGMGSLKFFPLPRKTLIGAHHFDITRDLSGLTKVYFDYELQFNFTDTRTTSAEKFGMIAWMGGPSIDNIQVSDTVIEINFAS